MKPLEIRKNLFDIQKACGLLRIFTKNRTFADYKSDPMLRSAVERQFEIVGEALAQMLKQDSSLQESITDAARIVAFRNHLIHGYASVSDKVVWGILEIHLPTLEEEVRALLEQEWPDD